MNKIIFETPELKVNCKGSLAGKSVTIEVLAVNPEDGKSYWRCAGWLSTTNTLHALPKTPTYAFEKAVMMLPIHKAEILNSMKIYATELGAWDQHALNLRLEHANREETIVSQHPIYKGHTFQRDFWVGKVKTAAI